MSTMKSGSLTPSHLHFLCLSPGDLENTHLLITAETADAWLTFIEPKHSTIRHVTATKVSDLNSQYCGNSMPNQF